MFQKAIFYFIRFLFPYTDNHVELCNRKKMTMDRRIINHWASISLLISGLMTSVSCEVLDDDIQEHAGDRDTTYIELNAVAEILSSLPLQVSHLKEVHGAAAASSSNGYDEEYTMRDLFVSPGAGVGDDRTRSTVVSDNPLRQLIKEYLYSRMSVKSGSDASLEPEKFIDSVMSSDIQIYWPYSENWDGRQMPVITFDPEDGSEVNIGYRLILNDDGSRSVSKVMVDEELACSEPVWVVNRNSDAGFKTLEMLRREDPDWGEGGGTIIVKPDVKSSDRELRTLILKDFTMKRNYDTWFAGASEFFVKTGSLDDFTASTEAELRLFNPMVTDFMISVRRSQVGKPQPFNAVLVSDWNPQMTHCAFMITEDDGGTKTEWKCTALVRIASKSYGVEINLPFNSRDDVVWRGQLSSRWIEANDDLVGHFGDVDLTFEVVEY